MRLVTRWPNLSFQVDAVIRKITVLSLELSRVVVAVVVNARCFIRIFVATSIFAFSALETELLVTINLLQSVIELVDLVV